MSRRVNMPAAEDLFRPTAVPDPPPEDWDDRAGQAPGTLEPAAEPGTLEPAAEPGTLEPGTAETEPPEPGTPGAGARGASGRVRHESKMTVYVTEDELLDLEHARLVLRRRHGLALDRGRLVREAVALVLEDLEDGGEGSPLVRRLTGE